MVAGQFVRCRYQCRVGFLEYPNVGRYDDADMLGYICGAAEGTRIVM